MITLLLALADINDLLEIPPWLWPVAVTFGVVHATLYSTEKGC